MYNRYIPQPDGTYQRNRMPDPASTPPAPPAAKPPDVPPPPCPPPEPPRRPIPPPRPRPNPPRREPSGDTTISGFLRHLLPKGFDTGDLLVVLLLLLMSGDCQEDQNTALLTMVLYLFL